MATKQDKRARVGILLMLALSALIIIAGVSLGSTDISFMDTVKSIISGVFHIENSLGVSPGVQAIVFKLRLPRVLLAFLTGMAMAMSGAVTQSVLHNPLASPYTLGVSSGASLGAAIVTVLGITLPIARELSLAAIGTVFGIAAVIVCASFTAKVDKNMGSATIVLMGMVLSLFLSAVFTLIAGLSKENMTMLMRWQMGSFGSKGFKSVGVLAAVILVCCTAIMLYARELDIISLGDEQAFSIGVNVKRVKWILLILTAVVSGTAVSFAGVIGFIDLIAPHLARRLFSPKHKYLCPLSALIGGCFMVVADLVSRIAIENTELPVGAVTAFIGAPFFAYVYFAGRRGRADAK